MLTRTDFSPKYRQNTYQNSLAFFKELSPYLPLFVAFF